jgi:hypothetical protein
MTIDVARNPWYKELEGIRKRSLILCALYYGNHIDNEKNKV